MGNDGPLPDDSRVSRLASALQTREHPAAARRRAVTTIHETPLAALAFGASGLALALHRLSARKDASAEVIRLAWLVDLAWYLFAPASPLPEVLTILALSDAAAQRDDQQGLALRVSANALTEALRAREIELFTDEWMPLDGGQALDELLQGREQQDAIRAIARSTNSPEDAAAVVESIHRPAPEELAGWHRDGRLDPGEIREVRGRRVAPAYEGLTGLPAPSIQRLDEMGSPGVRYPVWFGTDRAPHGRDSRTSLARFSGVRSRTPLMSLGRRDVHVPEGHRKGQIRAALWRRYWNDENETLRIVGGVDFRTSEDFSTDLQSVATGSPDDSVLVYVHGYRTSFTNAVLRAAQLGIDLQIPLACIYSWPSRATAARYSADEAAVGGSEAHFRSFIGQVAQVTDGRAIHVVCHSMGNRLVARTAKDLAADGVRIARLVLAAPDIDVALFTHLAAAYPKLAEGTTLYVSRRDRALLASRLFHSGDRVGSAWPVVVAPGLDTVDASLSELSLFNHDYYATSDPVRADIMGFFGGVPARMRPLLEQRSSPPHWRLTART